MLKTSFPAFNFMDKIQKALARLSDKERKSIKDVLEKLSSGKIEGLDVKKLKGRDDIYRVRKGKLRIIYHQTDKGFFILAIERRSDNTYDL
jgi:mRNA-degrading endonuclease RelE of RelBE toxin-antitoxin system